jgi:hypothetical protein
MTTLITTENFRIEFNGSSAYLLIDSSEQCIFATDTLRKAKNYLSKCLKYTNSNEAI